MLSEPPQPPNRTWDQKKKKKNPSMLATLKAGREESSSTCTFQSRGIHYSVGKRMASWTSWCAFIYFPVSEQRSLVWDQAWTEGRCSLPSGAVYHWLLCSLHWETKTSCGPWGQDAVGGSLRTSGRGRVFCKTQVALIIPSTERKSLAILAQRILCAAELCSVRLCGHNS